MSNQPIRKTEAHALERERARKQFERRDTIKHTLPFVIAAAVVLFIGVAVFLVMNQTASGTPRFQVDQDKIDLGNQPLGKTVRAAFTVKNVGDGTLRLDVPKGATLLEGCWPPDVVVGQTTLQPGQQTLISLEFMMHEGMDGKHLFEIPVKTNDPTQPLKKLQVASNWGPK